MSEANAPVLDPTFVEKIRSIGGDRLLTKMISLLLENAPKNMAKAETAVAESNGTNLYQSVHAVKSSACNFGAAPLVTLASKIEKCAESNVHEAIAVFEDFRETYLQLEVELKALQQELQ